MPQRTRAAVPWATVLVAVLAVVVFADRELGARLIFEREAIRHGEWWRLWTGNWVHFSASHLFWNLAVLMPAGIWVERLAPGSTRWLLGVGPAVIGVSLWLAEPGLLRYGGLSGLAAGVLVLLALTQLTAKGPDRWFWWSVLVLLAVKIAVESFAGQALFARFSDPELRSVPLAHVAGVAGALAVHFSRRRI